MLLVFVAISERIKWRIYERTKGKKQKTYISIRLNIMFLCIFVLFSAIIMQLGKVQIVEGEAYKNQVESSQNAITSIPVPRGQILDREGKTVVNNKSLRTITYTRVKGITSEDILKTAKDLAKVLEMPEQDINKLTDIDKKIFGCS
ncbi:penicillin-binding protein [Bacillus thuringiensis]|nr:penicillin-binding protein [Bacillus thuringiensis]